MCNHHNNPVLECFYHPLKIPLSLFKHLILHEPEEQHKLVGLPKQSFLLGDFESPAKCAWVTGFGGPSIFRARFLSPSFKSLLANLSFWIFTAACQSFQATSYIINLEKWNKLLIQIWLIRETLQELQSSNKSEFNGWQITLLAEYGKEKNPIV